MLDSAGDLMRARPGKDPIFTQNLYNTLSEFDSNCMHNAADGAGWATDGERFPKRCVQCGCSAPVRATGDENMYMDRLGYVCCVTRGAQSRNRRCVQCG